MRRIPIKRVRQFMVDGGLTHVVMLGHDGKSSWVGTCGKTALQAMQAAEQGNWLKERMSWPKSLLAYPRRFMLMEVRLARAKKRIAELEAEVEARDMAIVDLQADNEVTDER